MVFASVRRLFSAGYRVFFLAAGLFAIVSMALWLGWFAAQVYGLNTDPFQHMTAPYLWHAHEMIFGYGSAAIAGFLLTAAPNWTNSRGAPARFFVVASAIWFLGRLVMWAAPGLPAGVVALVDLAFVPIIAVSIAAMLLKRFNPRQFLIVVVIALFWVGNLFMHLEWLGLVEQSADAGIRIGLLALAALIQILGGRVTPAFTRNAMVRTGREDNLPRTPMPLAVVSILTAIVAVLAYIVGLPEYVVGVLCLLAGVTGLARLALWQGLWTRGQPILWTLHLSYGLNGLGLIALGAAFLGLGSEVGALHLLGIGGVAGMTISVMSRAAIGHSGRPLIAPAPVALAYALVPVAAAVRYAATVLPELYETAILVSGGLWLLAFCLYVVGLWRVFFGERYRENAA